MVSRECPTNPREASELDSEVVHPDTKGVKFTSQTHCACDAGVSRVISQANRAAQAARDGVDWTHRIATFLYRPGVARVDANPSGCAVDLP